MKKILIIRNAYSFDFGGGERVPVEIAAQLRTYGYDVRIISRSPKLLAYAATKHVPTVKGWWWSSQAWSGKRKILFPAYIFWMLLLIGWYVYLIIRTRPDVVHPQSRDDFIAATIAAKLFRKKVIWSDYADLKYIYRNSFSWFKNPIGKLILKLSRRAGSVILTSESDKRLIEKALGHKAPTNHQVIHYGVSDTEVKKIERNESDKNKIIFGATSRLVEAKGIGELIEAFEKVNKKHQDVRLWLFGEGPEESRFKLLAENNKNITFWGYPKDTLNRLAACDIFVHPSYLEGFSISLVEAAKLGLPMIACNVGGNPELVIDKKNGLLVPEKNVEALVGAMENLVVDEKTRIEYGKTARKTYEESLDFEKIIKEKIIPLYEQ